jgi:predicted nucleic acid-binding protein
MVICDTSGLLAAFVSNDMNHEAAAESLGRARPPRVVSPYVVAELDHMLRQRGGHSAGRAAIDRLTGGAYEIANINASELRQALGIDRRYADLGLGTADASLVVLAAKYDTRDLLTFDQRHFRKISPIQGGAFRLLPLDA